MVKLIVLVILYGMLQQKGSLKYRLLLVLTVLPVVTGWIGAVAQDAGRVTHKEGIDVHDPEHHAHVGKPPTFGEFFPAFRILCEQIAEDGRGEAFYDVISSLDRTPNCISCKNFFRGFATSCRAKLLGSRKATPIPAREEDADETEEKSADGATEGKVAESELRNRAVEKLPPFETVDLASDLGRELLEMERYAFFIEESLQVLHTSLQQPKVPEYLRVVGSYITAPFEDIRTPHTKEATK